MPAMAEVPVRHPEATQPPAAGYRSICTLNSNSRFSISNPLKDYVTDKKPEEELGKIKEYNPDFYDEYFIYPEEPMDPVEYSDDTVALTNVPFYASTRDIDKLFLGCGEVIGIQAERAKNSQSGKVLSCICHLRRFSNIKKGTY